MKYITDFNKKITNKIVNITKISDLLRKLKINKILDFLVPLVFLITFIAFISKNIIVSIISIIALVILILLAFLFIIESIINKNTKLIKTLFTILLITFSITVITVLLSKVAYWIVPLYYPNNDNNEKIYELVFNTYVAIISSGIGIAGTFFGTIYGGKVAMKTLNIQLDQQVKDNESKRKENEKFALKIISKLLSQEINNNLNVIEKNGLFKALNTNMINHGFPKDIKFEIYNNTKYELIKYSSNDSLVEEVIDVYGLLDILIQYTSLSSISNKDRVKLLTLESKIYNLIDMINNITIDNTYSIEK